MMMGILEQSIGAPQRLPQYNVGDSVPLAGLVDMKKTGNAAPPDGKEIKIRKPSGDPVTLSIETDDIASFDQTNEPGIYTVTSVKPPYHFAVNLNAAESDTTAMPTEELEQLGVAIGKKQKQATKDDNEHQRRLLAKELESRHKIWRWLIVAAIVILVIETFLAGRFARRVHEPEPSGGAAA
jgi:hypothetical protein